MRALRGWHDDESGIWLANRIENCRKGFSCGSLYCGRCRHRYAKGLQSRNLEQILKPFGSDYESAYARLRHVTILSEVVPLSEKDARLRAAITAERKRFNELKRACPKVQYQGAFELELIDFSLLMASACTKKKNTICSMMNFDPQTPVHIIPKQILLHTHGLWDFGPYDVSDVRDFVESRFALKAPYRVKFDRIYEGQPFEELAFKLGSYPFKDRVQYNLSFETSDYKFGPYFSDRDLARLALLYNRLSRNGFKNLLIGSKAR